MDKFSNINEVNFDYTDENGVIHVDGYGINEDDGCVLGYVFNGSFYPKDNDVLVCRDIMAVINEHLTEALK